MNQARVNVGDRVVCDLDSKQYTVVKTGLRNQLCGLKGVDLIGDALILEDDDGNEILVYEWEVSPT